MPIRNQIEAITKSLTEQPTFIYGTVNEINQLADDASFPCVFMYPLQPIDVSPQVNGSVDNTFSLFGIGMAGLGGTLAAIHGMPPGLTTSLISAGTAVAAIAQFAVKMDETNVPDPCSKADDKPLSSETIKSSSN